VLSVSFENRRESQLNGDKMAWVVILGYGFDVVSKSMHSRNHITVVIQLRSYCPNLSLIFVCTIKPSFDLFPFPITPKTKLDHTLDLIIQTWIYDLLRFNPCHFVKK